MGAVHTNQVALLTLAQETASLYMCVASCETFGALITVLATHQLSLVSISPFFLYDEIYFLVKV